MNNLAKDYRAALKSGRRIDKDSYRRELQAGLTLGSVLIVAIVIFVLSMVVIWIQN